MRHTAPFIRLNPGYKTGLVLIGVLLAGTPVWPQTDAALAELRTRANQGDADAQTRLGSAYATGQLGLQTNFAQAVEWLRQAAEKGHAPAQAKLGLLYEQGHGVPVDDGQAFKYYLLAAEKGFAPAQADVAAMYAEGRGVAQDFSASNLWFRRAADAGVPAAQFGLGQAYELGRGLKQDEAQAARWYKAAADAGNVSAQANYGSMLAEGRGGLAADAVQGYVLLARAVYNGAEPEARDALAARLTPAQRDAANRLLGDISGAPQTMEVAAFPDLGANSGAGAHPGVNPVQAERDRLELENKRLVARIAVLESWPKAVGENAPTAELIEARKQIDGLRQQVAALQAERDKWVRSLDPNVSERSAVAKAVADRQADLLAQVGQARILLRERDADLAGQKEANTQLTEANRDLKLRLAQVERDFKTVTERKIAAPETDLARRQLDATNAQLAALKQQYQTTADQLAAALQDGKTAQTRTAQLEKELATMGADDVAKKNVQLTRDNEQLAAFMNGNRADLDKAQARIAELEKQLIEPVTVRTEGGEAVRKIRAELDESNRTVEKLNSDIAELTVANEKLEMDLDSARKSTAAALAAQSQAVNAASPDSYRMEIGTLNAQIKQLEAQVEEERTGAAREVATLANQLQRTRETNRSLTEANRALVNTKDSESFATKEEIDQMQSRIKELTSAGDELRRQGQATAANLRTVSAERDDLRSQLVDARKVATTLPGLADEKAALQERLEAVGAELIQTQRDEEALQKANADLTKQLAASEEAAEKAQTDLAAMKAKAADAEKATDAHTASVADLTAANVRLEQERDELRRSVETYRADIARLNQNVRSTEQQRAEAERGGQQNVDALTAQMTQLRRELEAARVTQSRLTESYAAQERDRSATIAQLRSDNGALTARLNQAQGTLDQIAAAARLGTPAATIAAGGPVPVVRTTPAATSPSGEMRVHTVADGDSLSRISMRYYGTPNRWQEIYQANRDILQGSSALRVGQQLRIP